MRQAEALRLPAWGERCSRLSMGAYPLGPVTWSAIVGPTQLRDVILGGQDGLVNVLGIILGVMRGVVRRRDSPLRQLARNF